MTSPRIGIIGAGFHASTNILPALRLANIDVVALATRDVDRSAAALARHGLTGRPYGSSSALLQDENIDGVVIIAQPTDQHTLVLEALQNGKHVFVDKPLGMNAPQAREIAEAADAAKKHIMVGFMKRYAPAMLHLKDVMRSDSLGTPQSFHIRFGCDSTMFAPNFDDFIRLAAIHHLDIARFLFGEMTTVECRVAGAYPDVFAHVMVTTGTGMIGTIDLVGASSIPSEQDTISVTGTHGWARLDDTRSLTTAQASHSDGDWRHDGSTQLTYSPTVSTMSGGAQDLYTRGFVAELSAFAQLLEHGTPVSSTAHDNVLSTVFCDAIVAAADVPEAPRAVQFSAPGPVRDAINAIILSGEKTSSSDLLEVYQARGDRPPIPGEIRLLLGSSGEPIARMRFSEVRSFQLCDLTEETAALEDMSPANWTRAHGDYWESLTAMMRETPGREDWGVSSTTTVITTRFTTAPIETTLENS